MDGNSKPFNINDILEIRRLELALESAGVGTWEFDPAINQIRWCHRAKKLFSSSKGDFITLDDLLSGIHSKDRETFKDGISMVFDQNSFATFSMELRTHEGFRGRDRWLHCKGQSHRDIDTNTLRFLGTFIDITKEVEDRLLILETSEQAKSFQVLVKQAPMAIGLLKGPELTIEMGNEKLFEVWGKSAAITGINLADALPEIHNQIFLGLLQDVYRTGVPYTGIGAHAQLHRNGQLEDVYFDFVYSPIKQDQGEITGILVMANEVTQHFKALQELRASQARFKALIEQAPVAISLFVGKDMIIEVVNQPMIDYWGRDQSVIGKPLLEALPELASQPFPEILEQVYLTGVGYSAKGAPVELVVGGKHKRYYFDISYKPVLNADGKIYGIINTSIDVSTQVLAQKALQDSEARLRTLIESAPVAIGLFVGRELVVQLPNQAFIDIVGKGPGITGKPLGQIMPELESQPFLKILDDVFTTGLTYRNFGTQVNIVRHGVMSSNFYDITYSPVLDSEGKVYAILDIAIDVTERVNAERQIKHSQLQLLSLFEQSPVGIAIIHKDNLTFTMVNPFYGKLVGRKPEDIIGKSLMEALPEMKGQGFDLLLQKVIDTGVPFLSSEQAVDISYDGTLKTIYVNLAYQPQRDVNGNLMGVLVVATELTDQVLSRKKIEETETFLRGAIELAELGTYSIDLKTGILDYSERLKHWFGVQKEDQITFEKVYAAICETDLPDVIAAVNRAITVGSDGLYDMEYAMDAEKTGAARILHAQGKVLYDKEGAPVTMIGTAQDITLQRQARLALEIQVQERTEELAALNEELAAINEEYMATNEELSESNNLLLQSNFNLQQFAFVASHDLQEPLRKIQSFSNMLVSRHGDQLGEGRHYVQRMQAAADRMSSLIYDLLAFSRITNQKEMIQTVALEKIVAELLSDLELAIAESSAVVSVGELPQVQGDPSQLSQLFSNLVSNALKFRKPGVSPVIAISSQVVAKADLPSSLRVTTTVNKFHRIDVKDNGIGFDQQYAERIFQLFQRLHGRSEYAGTGIGLAICERVAANHGGKIDVISRPGEGATFSVFLPVS
jgi:PAS domain S-box-containing protein